MEKHSKWINCQNHEVPDIVLAEDAETVQGVWIEAATRLNIKLGVYSTPMDLITELHYFSARTEFYLDQNFAPLREKGTDIARAIRFRYPAKVILVTSYEKEDFKSELESGLINDVFGKFPWPFTSLSRCLQPHTVYNPKPEVIKFM